MKKSEHHQAVMTDAATASDEETRPLYPQALRDQGFAPNVAYIRKQPRDYRIGAILSTVFCFFPIGLYAIYYSYQVSKLFGKGDLTGSLTASDRARLLIQIAVITGCVLWFSGLLGFLFFSKGGL